MPKRELANHTSIKVLDDFKSYKITIQNCSVKTAEEYLVDLRTFFRYIVASRAKMDLYSADISSLPLDGLDIDYVKSVTTSEIYGFLTYSADVRHNAQSARARKLSAIKSFYRYYAKKARLIDFDPSADIDSPKPKKSLPKYLSLDESLALLKTVNEDYESPSRIRDYAIITLFLNCGMRLSELCGIRLSDISSDMKNLRVVGKGAKERIIYLNEACQTALIEYMSLRKTQTVRPEDRIYLFISAHQRKISPKTVQWMVYKYLDKAGLGYRRLSTHKLRHTAATLMYQSGNVDVRILKDILGHEQLNTTQIYTHVSDDSMRKAMSQNPLSGVKPKKE
ncbi:MAG: tyrosine-type recombinase/integrase [Clostridia bacterium]|nr:tyrosine-type recombinase/integrase [Clostridia bacterium]